MTTATESMQRLVSPYTGLVHRVHEVLLEPDDSRHIRFDCELASTSATIGVPDQLPAGGSGRSRGRALGAAVGEALERYSGSCLPPDSECVLASAEEIGSAAVEPRRFALFADSQYAATGFEFSPFSERTRVRWVRGRSIPDGDEVLLPLQLAYIWRQGEMPDEEVPIAPGSSSGMAAGPTEADAVLHGLLELIERDAVMLTWANRLSHRRLEWSSDSEMAAEDRARFAPSGLPYEVADLSVFFGVPTALAVIRGGPGGFGVGASSALTIRSAWDKALREAFQIRTALKRDLLDSPSPSFEDFDSVQTFLDHARFYADPERQLETAFLTAAPASARAGAKDEMEGDSAAKCIEVVAERLRARGVTAYWVDIAPPDVKEAGLHAVSVISPELHPIDAPYRHRFLGGKRLYEAAFELGLRPAPLLPADLNPLPHPFA